MKKIMVFKREVLAALIFALIFAFTLNVFACKDEPDEENNNNNNNNNNSGSEKEFDSRLKNTKWVTKEGDKAYFDGKNTLTLQWAGESEKTYKMLDLQDLRPGADSIQYYFAEGQQGQIDNVVTFTGGVITMVRINARSKGGSGVWEKEGGSGNPGGATNVTWTAVDTGIDVFFNDIAWGNNKFVAVGNKRAYSSDGISWTAVPAGSVFDTITWGNNKFVASGSFVGRLEYSPDGINWTAVDTGINATFNSIAWGNNKFVAVGNNFLQGGVMAYSSDGITWTAVANNSFGDAISNDNIHDIAWGNNKFVAVGNNGKVAYSSDGINWTVVANSTFDTTNTRIQGITWGNNKFVAVGSSYAQGTYNGKMAYSSDGISWTAVPNSALFGDWDIYQIAWGNNKFVAVGYSYSQGTDKGKMAYSSDGISWTAIANSTFGTSGIKAITWGNGKFVAVGDNGKIAYWDGNVGN
jgi:hypothetical protein